MDPIKTETADYRLSHTPMQIPEALRSLLSPVLPIEKTDTLSKVLSALQHYIFKRQLFNLQNPSAINCENDELGKVIGLRSFTLGEIKLHMLKLLLQENTSRKAELLMIVNGASDSKRKIEDEDDCSNNERKKFNTEIKEELSASSSPKDASGLEMSNIKEECGSFSDSSVDDGVAYKEANILAINRMYDVEYEIESDVSETSHSFETDSLSEIESLVGAAAASELCKNDSDQSFWADRSSEECFDSDVELSKLDLWECNKPNCKSLNKPTMRYCLKCWEVRTGWVIRSKERMPPQTKRKPKAKRKRSKEANENPQDEQGIGESPSTSQVDLLLSQSAQVDVPAEKSDESQKLCILCCAKPVSAAIVHGKIGHYITCYRCGRRLLSRNEPCPVCRRQIERVIHITT